MNDGKDSILDVNGKKKLMKTIITGEKICVWEELYVEERVKLLNSSMGYFNSR